MFLLVRTGALVTGLIKAFYLLTYDSACACLISNPVNSSSVTSGPSSFLSVIFSIMLINIFSVYESWPVIVLIGINSRIKENSSIQSSSKKTTVV